MFHETSSVNLVVDTFPKGEGFENLFSCFQLPIALTFGEGAEFHEAGEVFT